MNKHTPGPWDVYDDSPSEDYRKGTCILTLADSREYEGGDRVATVERFTDSALIAAAPELLYAAIAALDCLERPHAERDENRVRVMLDVAVAKAEGRA